jgi:ribosomal protein S18 acetylase RimI-like enzyme
MVTEKLRPPTRRLPEIDVRRVRDSRTGDDFRGIGSVCFHVPIAWFNEVFDQNCVWDRFAAYVGYVDGEPVATAATVASGDIVGAGPDAGRGPAPQPGGDVIGVYNVATLPDHRRRGYGEAVMRHALAEAERERPSRPVVLQSTNDGLRLYERMGFRTVARFSVYAS